MYDTAVLGHRNNQSTVDPHIFQVLKDMLLASTVFGYVHTDHRMGFSPIMSAFLSAIHVSICEAQYLTKLRGHRKEYSYRQAENGACKMCPYLAIHTN